MKLPKVQTNKDAKGNIVHGFVGKDSLIFPRILMLSYVRHIFANIKNPEYKYVDDIHASKIRIEDSNSFDFESMNIWPAISISRKPINFSNMFIGDRGAMGSRQNIGTIATMMANSGADIITGTLIVNIYSKNSYESETLAWLVMIMIKIGETDLMKSGFHTIDPGTISQPMLVGSQADIYMTTLAISYTLSIDWIKNKIIKDIYEGCIKIDFDYSMVDGAGDCEPGL